MVSEIGKTRVEYTLQVKASFNTKLAASNVTIKIPTPTNCVKVDCKVVVGKAKWVAGENVVIWK
jgi:AP-2 complex subunit mu-1